MKRLLRVLLLVWCLLGVSASAWANPPQAVKPSAGKDEAARQWDEVRAFLKQGAYRDALQSLEVLKTLTPDDPHVDLYRSLCERRLKAASPFTELTPSQSTSLQQQLLGEERAQRRTAAQLKALDAQLKKEQAKWDQELKVLQQQAEREERLKRQQAQAEAVTRARAEQEQRRALAQQEALRRAAEQPVSPAQSAVVTPEPFAPTVPESRIPTSVEAPSTPPAPTSPERSGISVPVSKPTVELPPVVVPTAPTEPTEEEKVPIAPSLVGRPKPPPGAVQINARQMHVASDRKLAIAEGDVEVLFENAVLTCDRLTLFTDTKDAYAEGHVRIEEGNQLFRGDMVHYNLENKKGRFLEGTVSSPPWHEHGRSVEHIAEGVFDVLPGYLTSCDLEPPHFKFYGRRAIVFADDKIARGRNVILFSEQLPLIYLPWLSVADRQTPFFLIPGKDKRWGYYVLSGYRYELPGPANHKGTLKLDWRENFLWGTGLDHRFESERMGKGLLRLYYNDERPIRRPEDELPKGAGDRRYRVLWRHVWQPMPSTSIFTNVAKFSDADFRKEFLFRPEFTREDSDSSFISTVSSYPGFSISSQVVKRMNRFETVNELFPQVTLQTGQQRIGETKFFSDTALDVANFQTKRTHSDNDTDVIRVDWFQQLRYALGLLRPIEVTPRVGVRQTYYTKDIQSGDTDRPQGNRDLISGQFSMGTDASLKLFRIFPVVTNALGLDINWLRHVVTPTVAYDYLHQPTVPSSILTFAKAGGTMNQVTFGLENKLQTRRAPRGQQLSTSLQKMRSVDLARLTASIPYTFQGNGNKQGGRLGDWGFDAEFFPWPWLRVESNLTYPSHFLKGTRDQRITQWNLDVVMAGGPRNPIAASAPPPITEAPSSLEYHIGPLGGASLMIPPGQWYLGFGNRYVPNDKTESIVQFDMGLGKKWEIGTFHRFTWKEVAGSSKRFNNTREYQYRLRRDLHDWLGEFVYRVDREYGEELFFILTLKAYPEMPIELEESYHQPKIGSQSSPFSPIQRY